MATRDISPSRTRDLVKAAVDDQLALAEAAGNARVRSGELATSAEYDPQTKRLRIELVSGVGLRIPVERIQGLAELPTEVLQSVRIDGGGIALHWPSADVDLSVPNLVAGCFGSRQWMSALGKLGGEAKTKAKREAARENGKKGGRPKKPFPRSATSARSPAPSAPVARRSVFTPSVAAAYLKSNQAAISTTGTVLKAEPVSKLAHRASSNKPAQVTGSAKKKKVR